MENSPRCVLYVFLYYSYLLKFTRGQSGDRHQLTRHNRTWQMPWFQLWRAPWVQRRFAQRRAINHSGKVSKTLIGIILKLSKAIVNRFVVPGFSKQLMPPIFFILQVNEGTNITADSFYSSQGRADPSFRDENLSKKCVVHAVSSSAENQTPITWNHYLHLLGRAANITSGV